MRRGVHPRGPSDPVRLGRHGRGWNQRERRLVRRIPMKAVLGLHVTNATVLSIRGAGLMGASPPVLKISKRTSLSPRWIEHTGDGSWDVPLPPGDFLIRVEGGVRGPL